MLAQLLSQFANYKHYTDDGKKTETKLRYGSLKAKST